MLCSESLQAKEAGALTCLSTSLSSMGSPWESVGIPTLDSLQAASNSFKTPKKVRLGAVLGPATIPVNSRLRGLSFSSVAPLDIDNDDSVEKSKLLGGSSDYHVGVESTKLHISVDLHGV